MSATNKCHHGVQGDCGRCEAGADTLALVVIGVILTATFPGGEPVTQAFSNLRQAAVWEAALTAAGATVTTEQRTAMRWVVA